MRFFFATLLAAGSAAALPTTAQAARLAMSPPGYHAPRRLHNARQQPYQRLPLRLTFGFNLATYNGDVTGRLPDNTLRVGLGVGLVQSLSPHLTFATELSYFKLKAVDQHPERGLRFEGTNGLLTATLRYNLLADKSMFFGPAYKATPWQPFVEAGVGVLLFDPTAAQVVDGVVVVLPPEQRNRNYTYPHVGGVLPVGGGVTYRASRYFALTLEGLYYFTTTDLLDDVSARANPNLNDKFITGVFKLEFGLHKSKGKPLVHFD